MLWGVSLKIPGHLLGTDPAKIKGCFPEVHEGGVMNYRLEGSGGILLAIALAALGLSGCSDGTDNGLEGVGGDGGGTESSGPVISSAAMSGTNARALSITFAAPMQTDTVDASVFMPAPAAAAISAEATIDLEQQDAIRIRRHSWSADRRTLTLIGPFPYCTTFSIEVAPGATDDQGLRLDRILRQEFLSGANPGNFSRNAVCRSDLVIAPAFGKESDLLLLGGEAALAGGAFESKGVDTADTWYFNASQECTVDKDDVGCALDAVSDVQLLPGIAPDSGPVLAMVGTRLGNEGEVERLLRWDAYSAADETPASVHEAAAVKGSMLGAILGVADGNGDAVDDVLVGWRQGAPADEMLWNVRSIDATPLSGMGQDLLAESLEDALYGREGLVARVALLANLDGDGAKSIVELRERMFDVGNGMLVSGDAQIRIAHQGRTDLIEEDDPQREVLGMAAADVNGDGAADLVIMDARHRIAEEDLDGNGAFDDYQLADNRIRILFGGAFTGGIRSLGDSDVEILKKTTWDGMNTERLVLLRSAGDLHADGYADLAIEFSGVDPSDGEVKPFVYLLAGRGDWSGVDDLDEASDILFRSLRLPAIEPCEVAPDLDNDGYDDLFLRDVTSKESLNTVIFRGGPGLTGELLDPAAADATIQLLQP